MYHVISELCHKKLFCGCSLAVTSTGWVGLWLCGFMSWSTKRLNRQWFWFKTSQKMGLQLKVSSDRLVELEIELGTPGYKVGDLSTTNCVIKEQFYIGIIEK